MFKKIFPLFLFTLAFAALSAAAYGAPTAGEMSLYAPLVQVQPVSTGVPPTEVPPTEVPPTEVPPTEVPTEVPTTTVTPVATPFPSDDEPYLLVEQGEGDKDLVWYDTADTYRFALVSEENNDLARVSPDGEKVVFQQQLDDFSRSSYVVAANGGTPSALTAIGSLIAAGWSPDSQYISYGDTREVNTYELSSGITATIRLAHESFEYVAYAWNPRNGLIYSYNTGSSAIIDDTLYRNNSAGTEPLLIYESEGRDALRKILEDGRLVVSSDATYGVLNSDGTNYQPLPGFPSDVYPGNGYFSPAANARIYKSGDTIYLEDWTGEVISEFVPPCGAQYNGCFLYNVQWQTGGNEVAFELNRQGSGGISDYQLYRLTLDGSAPVLVDTQTDLFNATYSREGQYLAYEAGDDVVIMDTTTDTVTATISDPDGGETNIADWRPIVE